MVFKARGPKNKIIRPLGLIILFETIKNRNVFYFGMHIAQMVFFIFAVLPAPYFKLLKIFVVKVFMKYTSEGHLGPNHLLVTIE